MSRRCVLFAALLLLLCAPALIPYAPATAAVSAATHAGDQERNLTVERAVLRALMNQRRTLLASIVSRDGERGRILISTMLTAADALLSRDQRALTAAIAAARANSAAAGPAAPQPAEPGALWSPGARSFALAEPSWYLAASGPRAASTMTPLALSLTALTSWASLLSAQSYAGVTAPGPASSTQGGAESPHRANLGDPSQAAPPHAAMVVDSGAGPAPVAAYSDEVAAAIDDAAGEAAPAAADMGLAPDAAALERRLSGVSAALDRVRALEVWARHAAPTALIGVDDVIPSPELLHERLDEWNATAPLTPSASVTPTSTITNVGTLAGRLGRGPWPRLAGAERAGSDAATPTATPAGARPNAAIGGALPDAAIGATLAVSGLVDAVGSGVDISATLAQSGTEAVAVSAISDTARTGLAASSVVAAVALAQPISPTVTPLTGTVTAASSAITTSEAAAGGASTTTGDHPTGGTNASRTTTATPSGAALMAPVTPTTGAAGTARSPSPSPSPTATATASPTATMTASATPSSTATDSPTPSPTSTDSPTSTASPTPSPTPTATASATASATATMTPSAAAAPPVTSTPGAAPSQPATGTAASPAGSSATAAPDATSALTTTALAGSPTAPVGSTTAPLSATAPISAATAPLSATAALTPAAPLLALDLSIEATPVLTISDALSTTSPLTLVLTLPSSAAQTLAPAGFLSLRGALESVLRQGQALFTQLQANNAAALADYRARLSAIAYRNSAIESAWLARLNRYHYYQQAYPAYWRRVIAFNAYAHALHLAQLQHDAWSSRYAAWTRYAQQLAAYKAALAARRGAITAALATAVPTAPAATSPLTGGIPPAPPVATQVPALPQVVPTPPVAPPFPGPEPTPFTQSPPAWPGTAPVFARDPGPEPSGVPLPLPPDAVPPWDGESQLINAVQLIGEVADVNAVGREETTQAALLADGALDGITSYADPLQGPVVTYWGQSTIFQSFHAGIDIAAPMYTPIRAAADGVVTWAGYAVPGQRHDSYGLCVVIRHNARFSTLYAHMDDQRYGLLVRQNDLVRQGQVIGYVGLTGWTTGPHLHFEMREDNVAFNPLLLLPMP